MGVADGQGTAGFLRLPDETFELPVDGTCFNLVIQKDIPACAQHAVQPGMQHRLAVLSGAAVNEEQIILPGDLSHQPVGQRQTVPRCRR